MAPFPAGVDGPNDLEPLLTAVGCEEANLSDESLGQLVTESRRYAIFEKG